VGDLILVVPVFSAVALFSTRTSLVRIADALPAFGSADQSWILTHDAAAALLSGRTSLRNLMLKKCTRTVISEWLGEQGSCSCAANCSCMDQSKNPEHELDEGLALAVAIVDAPDGGWSWLAGANAHLARFGAGRFAQPREVLCRLCDTGMEEAVIV